MNWNKWIQQTHRWLSIAFTVAVIINGIAVVQGKYTAKLGLLAAAMLAFAIFHRYVLVHAAIRHQVEQCATHRVNRQPGELC